MEYDFKLKNKLVPMWDDKSQHGWSSETKKEYLEGWSSKFAEGPLACIKLDDFVRLLGQWAKEDFPELKEFDFIDIFGILCNRTNFETLIVNGKEFGSIYYLCSLIRRVLDLLGDPVEFRKFEVEQQLRNAA